MRPSYEYVISGGDGGGSGGDGVGVCVSVSVSVFVLITKRSGPATESLVFT